MSEQFSLFDSAPPPSDGLFFGIYPDATTAEAIAGRSQALRDAHGLAGRPLATDRFHVTLHEIGVFAGLPRGIIDKAQEAAALVAASPFDVVFDRAGSFNNRGANPFVLRGEAGLAALVAFQQALGLAMARTGLGRQVSKTFTPHVTLLYDKALVPDVPVDAVGWTVSEFVLVHSLIGQTRHIPLGRWRLAQEP